MKITERLYKINDNKKVLIKLTSFENGIKTITEYKNGEVKEITKVYYNDNNQIIKTIYYFDNKSQIHTNEYDEKGRIIRNDVVNGDGSKVSYEIYKYLDDYGSFIEEKYVNDMVHLRMTRLFDKNGNTIKFSSSSYSNGILEADEFYESTHEYNENNDKVKEVIYEDGHLDEYNYSYERKYDEKKRLTEKTSICYDGDYFPGKTVISYTYDSSDRVINKILTEYQGHHTGHIEETGYEYDSNGNLIKQTLEAYDGMHNLLSIEVTVKEYNEDNLLIKEERKCFDEERKFIDELYYIKEREYIK